tara:strand:+ start:1700 stop:2389 length:690 start_codon:yes stop_codon:yes gene_type:complete
MKKQDTVAIIVAAGKGTRMSKKDNKLLLPLGKRTIIEFSLDAFLNHHRIRKIFLTISSKYREFYENIFPRKIVLVDGGKRRQDSVHNALLKVMQEKKVPELILVHDGARPFCSLELIDRVIDSAINYGASIPVLPLMDTIRIVGKEKTRVVDRNKLFSVQTPQGFRSKLLNDASFQAIEKKWEVTDDAALIERMGGKVKTVKGEYCNFKITTPEDLDRANYILYSNNLL